MRYVRERDGRLTEFDQYRIMNAIWKAVKAVGGKDRYIAQKLSDQVVAFLLNRFGDDGVPTVEEIQDLVEEYVDREWARADRQSLHFISASTSGASQYGGPP